MIRKFFLKKYKKVDDDVISEFIYESFVKELVESKYREINDAEEDFIKHLLYKLHQNNQQKLCELKRMSNNSIEFRYNNYPVGKIKLQGKNTWMQILTSLYDQKKLKMLHNLNILKPLIYGLLIFKN